jgi:hypothetical protein
MKGSILLMASICVALSISTAQTAQGQHDPDDDDTVLEFYWTPATGNIHHYNVYLSIDGVWLTDPVDTTTKTPTLQDPYAVPEEYVQYGKEYRLKVEAVAADSITTGPMSKPSEPVWCERRSPGDEGGQAPGDANGNSGVGWGDQGILDNAWGAQRGNTLFDYRADLNYDGVVNILDLVIMGRNWGRIY